MGDDLNISLKGSPYNAKIQLKEALDSGHRSDGKIRFETKNYQEAYNNASELYN